MYPKMWSVTAGVTRREGNSSVTKQLPIFYLDSNVQGILSEATALLVALDILAAFPHTGESVSVHVAPVWD